MYRAATRTAAAVFFASVAAAAGAQLISAQSAAPPSCDQFMIAQEQVNGKAVGQESCRVIEHAVTLDGRKYRRLDIGITGTIDGYTATAGVRDAYFTTAPEFVFTQVGNTSELRQGIGRYEAEKGSAVVLLYPEEPGAWNGRMWLTAHGAGPSFREGTLKAWDKNYDSADPWKDISKYERLMLSKGFAVAKTRRSAHKDRGDITVTFEDGTQAHERNLTEQPKMILGWGLLAENILKNRLGKEPSRTYWYGHSSGARPGRLVNYQPGLNRDAAGKPIIDGILAGDSGAGMWQPILQKDGKDVLFTTDADRARFVKQIETSHMLYWNTTSDNPPPYATRDYLANKRLNAKVLREKGLGNKHRVYEIEGVSHSGGEYLPEGKRGPDVQILDISRVMDGMIDLLDNWVEKGVEPPPSMSNWHELGDVNKDGTIENPAIRLPEIACPTGIYAPYPPSGKDAGITETFFTPFDGQGLEPLDGRGLFVDMNLSRVRDFRETTEQAWRRLGLLKPGETFTKERYNACVQATLDALKTRGLLTPRVENIYTR
jgi:hypothetical protein